MATTSDFPITVDGVRLDTLAWNVESVRRATPSRRTADAVVPGLDGVIPAFSEDYEAPTFGLTMFVRGTDPDGLIPGGGAIARFRANLDELIHLFSRRWGLIDLRETVSAGVERQAWAKPVDTIQPEVRPGAQGSFAVALLIPGAFWQDVAAVDWTQNGPSAGTAYEVVPLRDSTAPVTDAVVLVTGPVTNPTITDVASGGSVTLNAAVPAGAQWRLNAGTWATRTGALGLGSADVAGADAQATTRWTGFGARFLTLNASRDTGSRKVKIVVSGTGMTGATSISVRARRKFL